MNPIDKTLDQIRNDLFIKIAAVQQDGWLPQNLNLNRGPARGLIELWAWGLFQLYSFLKLILEQAFPLSSTGLWLDLHCAQVDIKRLEKRKAKGVVYVSKGNTEGNITITKNSIFKTKPDGSGNVYRFIVEQDTILPDGLSEIAVQVESEEYGTPTNVVAGQITEIVTVLPGIDAVENRADWLETEGTDPEKDEKLHERYILAWKDVNGSTKYAYESWARSVPGVVAVLIVDNHPRGQGSVDVIIRGTAGIPTSELLDKVSAIVVNNRPINDNTLVKGPTPVPIDINPELELLAGDPDTIIADATNRINAMFLDPSPISSVGPLDIGDDVPLDLFIAEIMRAGAGYIKKINWQSPVADTAVPFDGIAVLNSLVFTYIWAVEP